MKNLVTLILILLSIAAYPGEKGNGLGDLAGLFQMDDMDKIFQASVEAKEVTLPKMAKKEMSLDPMPLEIQKYGALIRLFIVHEEWEMLADITINDPSFAQAFKGKKHKKFWTLVKDAVIKTSSEEKWEAFKTQSNLRLP